MIISLSYSTRKRVYSYICQLSFSKCAIIEFRKSVFCIRLEYNLNQKSAICYGMLCFSFLHFIVLFSLFIFFIYSYLVIYFFKGGGCISGVCLELDDLTCLFSIRVTPLLSVTATCLPLDSF